MSYLNYRRIFHGGAALVVGLGGIACTSDPDFEPSVESPDFMPLNPTAYQRQIMGVDGDTGFAWVVFDPGLPTETSQATGLFATNFFQVPVGAAPGDHQTLLRNSQGDSDEVTVTIRELDQNLWPAPRIEDIGVFFSTPGPSENLLLTVSAANLDVDSHVTVTRNGANLAVTSDLTWGAIPMPDQLFHDPATFGYPIFHYMQRLFVVEDTNPGDLLSITVTNTLDGRSDTEEWEVPQPDELDSDGDGLLDSYDGGTYTAPSGASIDLEALGTSKYRKDILLEADWIAAAVPQANDWTLMEDAFAAAPVLSPNGAQGINMIIDRGQGGAFTNGGTILPDHDTIEFNNSTGTTVDFWDVKGDPANFDPDRLELFHYLIVGRARPNGSSGRGEIIGNDLLVSMVNFGVWGQPVAETGTFMHEFGHNLGLRHGGFTGSGSNENDPWKPNLSSLMGYRWQFAGVDVDCDYAGDASLRFSEGDRVSLDETNADESQGVCDGLAVDFDGNGSNTDTGAVNMNPSRNNTATDTHDDNDQWGNIRLAFRTDPDSDWDND